MKCGILKSSEDMIARMTNEIHRRQIMQKVPKKEIEIRDNNMFQEDQGYSISTEVIRQNKKENENSQKWKSL